MNKNNNKGCFSGILGTVFVVLGVVVYTVVASLICRIFIQTRFGEDSACAILTLTTVGMIVAFVLYEAIFIVWQVKLSKKASGKEGDQMQKVFRLTLVGCICLSLLFAIFSANTFTALREDSISKVCFVETKEYRWDERNDVLRYSFSCDAEGGLSFRITMKDGEIIDVLGGATSLSQSFREQFDVNKTNLLTYSAYLSEQFDASEYIIEKKVNGMEYMERYYKDSAPAIWEQIERIIASEIGSTAN